MRTLTTEQQQKIQKAVERAEEQTSGEIVPVIVQKSDDYPGARWRLAIVTGLLLGFLAYWFFPSWDALAYFWIQLPGIGLGYWLGGFSWALRSFLHRDKLREEVHQRALEAFFYQKVHTTEGATGVLLFVSLLERRVEILADSGINNKVEKGTWDHIIRDLVKKVHEGGSDGIVDGVCVAVEECGTILKNFFPASSNNQNELKNSAVFHED